MSFVGKKNSANEFKMKERTDENIKVAINDKIFELMTKNNTVKEKVNIFYLTHLQLEKIKNNNYIIREDEDFLDTILGEIKKSLETVKTLIKDFDILINRKYSNDVDLKDKLTLIKGQMCKTLDKEIENFNKNAAMLINLKNNLTKKQEYDYNEGNSLLSDCNADDTRYKVCNNQIKYFDDISKYRKGQIENIYSKVLMVQKITDEINSLTHQQDKKLEKIDDNIEPVMMNAKGTFKALLEAQAEDKKFKNNNCCIILMIILAVLFLLMVIINMNR